MSKLTDIILIGSLVFLGGSAYKKISGLQLPTVNMPDLSFPDLSFPDLSFPDLSFPDVNIPDINIPDINIPDINIPDVNIPDVNIPDIPDIPDTGLMDSLREAFCTVSRDHALCPDKDDTPHDTPQDNQPIKEEGWTEIDPYYLGEGAGTISHGHEIGATASPTIDTLGYSHVTGDWLGSGA
jgi:hypothetical protein